MLRILITKALLKLLRSRAFRPFRVPVLSTLVASFFLNSTLARPINLFTSRHRHGQTIIKSSQMSGYPSSLIPTSPPKRKAWTLMACGQRLSLHQREA